METCASPGARNRTAGSNPATKRQTRMAPRTKPARNTEPASAYQPSPGMRGTALTSAGIALEERDHFAVAALFCHPDGGTWTGAAAEQGLGGRYVVLSGRDHERRAAAAVRLVDRSEEHTSELQSHV